MKLILLCLSVFVCFQCLGQITNYPMAAPSLLEVNLAQIPLNVYSNTNCRPGKTDCSTNAADRWIYWCSGTETVRQCYQSALTSYAENEHVTGVRFMFGVCGSADSTALIGCNSTNPTNVTLSTAWETQMGYFLADIYCSTCTTHITNITPSFHYDANDVGYKTTTSTSYDTCGYGGVNTSLWWNPTVPFAYRTSDSFPYGFQMNNAYSCASFNTVNFVGWPNMFAVENAVLTLAASNHLYVEEFDVRQELSTENSTLAARYMYDPKDTSGGPTGRDVLDSLRYYMGQHGYSWTQINFSVSGAGNADSPGADCGSVFGDSARILPSSELASMYGGGTFGWPNPTWTNDLPCGGSASGFVSQPMNWSLPEIHDIHNTACLLPTGTNPPCASGQSQSTVALEAKTFFSDVEAFLNSFCSSGWRHNSTQMCGALFMLGETDVYQPTYSGSPINCVGSPVDVPAGNVQGFNSSSLAGRSISGGQPGVIFRPWTDPRWDASPVGCFTFPQVLQPTYVPTP